MENTNTCACCNLPMLMNIPPMCCGCEYHPKCYCAVRSSGSKMCVKCPNKILKRDLRKTKSK